MPISPSAPDAASCNRRRATTQDSRRDLHSRIAGTRSARFHARRFAACAGRGRRSHRFHQSLHRRSHRRSRAHHRRTDQNQLHASLRKQKKARPQERAIANPSTFRYVVFAIVMSPLSLVICTRPLPLPTSRTGLTGRVRFWFAVPGNRTARRRDCVDACIWNPALRRQHQSHVATATY